MAAPPEVITEEEEAESREDKALTLSFGRTAGVSSREASKGSVSVVEVVVV